MILDFIENNFHFISMDLWKMKHNQETLQQAILCIQNITLVGLHKVTERLHINLKQEEIRLRIQNLVRLGALP